VETIFKFPLQQPRQNRGHTLLYITSATSRQWGPIAISRKTGPRSKPRSSDVAEAEPASPKLPFA